LVKRSNGEGSRYFRTTKRGRREAVAVGRRLPGKAAPMGTASVADLPKNATAKQRQQADAAAMALAEKRLAEKTTGPADAHRMTLGRYADRWLELVRSAGNLRASTLVNYERQVGIVKNAIGHVRLADVRREHVVELWGKCPGDATRVQVHARVSTILNDAWDQDYPVARSVLKIAPPAYDYGDAPTMSPAQAVKFIAELDRYWALLFRVLYVAGLRESEVCALLWSDLDEIGRAITLTHQLDRYGPSRVELKAKRQRRRIALDPETVAFLADHRRREIEAGRGQPGDWVFPYPIQERGRWKGLHRGEPVNQGALYWTFKKTLKAAGLPNELRPHAMRSGAVVAALEAGCTLDSVSRRAGHGNVRTTDRYYTRFSDQADRKAAAAVARRLKRA
jgi:integrase